MEMSNHLTRITQQSKSPEIFLPSYFSFIALVTICNFIFFVLQEDKLLGGKDKTLLIAASLLNKYLLSLLTINQTVCVRVCENT